METYKDLPLLRCPTQAAWHDWLRRHRESTPKGAWLVIARRGSAAAAPTYEQAREEALAFGWIDGLMNSHDAAVYYQRFTPRRARSTWSRINRDICERLIADGRMRSAGMEQVERAKADGRWDDAYRSTDDVDVPEDSAAALRARPRARSAFAAASRSQRYMMVRSILDAKRPATRARRIATFMDRLEHGELP